MFRDLVPLGVLAALCACSQNAIVPVKQTPTTPQLASVAPMMAQVVEAQRAEHGVPGVQMVELADCKPVSALESGIANVTTGAPVERETLFEAASLSKPVFAYIVMMLVDEGVVDLDRPLAADGFANPRITNQASYEKLTARLLLSHQSGLPNWGADPLGPDKDAPLDFAEEVGTYNYSGEGFQLLQAYVEWKTGKTLPQLFDERLGIQMPHSVFATPLPVGAKVSRGHDGSESRSLMVTDQSLAAASLVTTAFDYARFMSLVCSGEGLSPATHTQMLTVQSDWYDTEDEVPTARTLGWSKVKQGGDEFIVHGGNNGEYRALAGFDPEDGEGIVILTNSATGHHFIEAMVGLMNTSR